MTGRRRVRRSDGIGRTAQPVATLHRAELAAARSLQNRLRLARAREALRRRMRTLSDRVTSGGLEDPVAASDRRPAWSRAE